MPLVVRIQVLVSSFARLLAFFVSLYLDTIMDIAAVALAFTFGCITPPMCQ